LSRRLDRARADPSFCIFRDNERRDGLELERALKEVRHRARAAPKLSLQELKEAVSLGLDLADYDARLQQSRMKRKLEAEKAAKLEEEEKP
jgi:hypothetical protein